MAQRLEGLNLARPSARSGGPGNAEFRRGWGVLLGCLLGMAVGGPTLFYLPIGVLMKPIEADLHVSRTVLSGGLLLFTVVTAIASPFIGGLIDRIGVRIPIVCSLVGLVLVYGGFGLFLRSAAGFYALSLLCALAGAGSTALAFTRAVSDWFVEARGLAVGAMLMGSALTVALVPSLLTAVIAADGWRAGYFALAGLVLIALPVIAACVRLDPRKAGRSLRRDSGDEPPGLAELYSPIFWMLIASFLFLSLALSGLTVHFVPMLTDGGIGPATAARFAGLMGAAAIASRLIMGALIDRIFAPFVAIPVFLFAAGGCLVLALAGPVTAPLAAVAIGMGAGSELALMGYLTGRYFAPRLYGRAYGWQFGAFAVANGLSPVWMAAVHDEAGSYRLALHAVAVLLLIPSAIFLRLPRY